MRVRQGDGTGPVDTGGMQLSKDDISGGSGTRVAGGRLGVWVPAMVWPILPLTAPSRTTVRSFLVSGPSNLRFSARPR